MPRRRLALLCFVAALALASPPAGAKESHSARSTAARAFADRTASFARRLVAADHHARAVLSRRRRAAAGCLDVWQSAPLSRRSDINLIYFEYLSGALWAVDGPLYTTWIAGLQASRPIARLKLLKHVADGLAGELGAADAAYASFPDPCGTLRAWQAGGWTDATAPPALAGLRTLGQNPDPLGFDDRKAAGKLLVAASKHGKLAASVLDEGIDEPDSRVEAHKGCDPVGVLVDSEDYGTSC